MNQDMMRDPTTAASRIYVGNLKENTQRNDLQTIFGKYGVIRGIMINRNFGFVQFDNEQSAENAIENEHQNTYNNRKITVSKIQKKGNQKMGDKGNGGGGGGAGSGNQNQNPNQNQNQNQGNNQGNNQIPPQNQNDDRNMNAANNNSGPSNNSMPSNANAPQQNHQSRPLWRNNRNNRNNNNDMNMQTDRERSPLDGGRDNDRWNQDGGSGMGSFNNFRHNNRNMNSNNMGNNSNNMNMNNAGGFGNNNSFGNNNMRQQGSGMPPVPTNPNRPLLADKTEKMVLNGGVLQGYASARSIRAQYPNANDCEIVVMEKHLIEYAEHIEGRLKRLGLLVDLLFPNPDIAIGKLLSNIVGRGALYAIIVTPQNKDMGSVTVNILYGVPSEHRNMPVDSAIDLIYKNFEQLKQGENGDVIGEEDSAYASIPKASVQNPDSIQHLINLLSDNRTLTVLQFDCIIKYLQERREIQYKFELGDSAIDPQSTQNVDNKSDHQSDATGNVPLGQQSAAPPPRVDPEEELQKRLLEILNKPTITNIEPAKSQPSAESPQRRQPNPSNVKSPNQMSEPKLLHDPKVQKALDSLFF